LDGFAVPAPAQVTQTVRRLGNYSKGKEVEMSDPQTISDANHLVNDAITSVQNGDTETANQQFEQAAQIYDQNGASEDAQDARDLITPA